VALRLGERAGEVWANIRLFCPPCIPDSDALLEECGPVFYRPAAATMAWRALRKPLGTRESSANACSAASWAICLAPSPTARRRARLGHDRSTGSRFSKRHFGARKHKNGPQTQVLGVLCWLNGTLQVEANGELRRVSPHPAAAFCPPKAAAVPIHGVAPLWWTGWGLGGLA
jgi:hypothetical protein